jgi:hypothetical protein
LPTIQFAPYDSNFEIARRDFLRLVDWLNGSLGQNGCADRSRDTSAVPQIADDFGAPRKSAEVGQQQKPQLAAVLVFNP